jgi:hypothetical protein
MIRLIWHFYRKILNVITLPLALRRFLSKDVGSDYGVGLRKKLPLVFRFMRNVRKIETASHWREHLEIATAILSAPKELEGAVIECGCYLGGATVNLSLVCSLTKRGLVVCDSFQGLPEPESDDRVHCLTDGRRSAYRKGMFSGSLELVKSNVRRYGCIHVCDFVPGWFQDTLGELDERFILAFLDVDLRESLKTCLLALWDKMQPGSKMFCHEAPHMDNVSIFWDEQLWRDHTAAKSPPGFVGAGTGLSLLVSDSIVGSALGYALKQQDE